MGSENDPIADLLTRLRNGSMARHRFIDISWSKMKESIVRILKEEGYVAHYLVKEVNKKGSIRVFLKYGADRSPVFLGLKRVSRPSLRRYVACQEIPRVLGNIGTAILSTSYGVMTGRKAKEKNIGGEVLCTVW